MREQSRLSGALETTLIELARHAKEASRVLAVATPQRKNAALAETARRLRGPGLEPVLAANAKDLAAAEASGLSGAMLDRLRLSPERVAGVADGVEQIIALPDPVGQRLGMRRLDNGLEVGRMRVPLGLIVMIYESRPNVTVDAAALCIKSGNGCVLRGGSEAFHSNQAFAAIVAESLNSAGLPPACVSLVPTTDRAATGVLIGLEGIIDVAVPRGGPGLIRYVTEHARIPVIQHYKGVCHVFVDAAADLDKAEAIAVNAKAQRPGVCNAMETLLVDAAVAETFLPRLGAAMERAGVELRGDRRARERMPQWKAATDEDWDAEYLDLILSVAVVDGIDAAIEHIAAHGSGHTEAIVTENYSRAQRWVREVDASLVLVNASTRFNDGFQLGLGAELGISTSKLHAYGPMGLQELTTTKWIGYGDGQIRQ